jgi:hypothetical protein
MSIRLPNSPRNRWRVTGLRGCVKEWVVPGPYGEPDISLLICLPKHAATRTPAITTSTVAA